MLVAVALGAGVKNGDVLIEPLGNRGDVVELLGAAAPTTARPTRLLVLCHGFEVLEDLGQLDAPQRPGRQLSAEKAQEQDFSLRGPDFLPRPQAGEHVLVAAPPVRAEPRFPQPDSGQLSPDPGGRRDADSVIGRSRKPEAARLVGGYDRSRLVVAQAVPVLERQLGCFEDGGVVQYRKGPFPVGRYDEHTCGSKMADKEPKEARPAVGGQMGEQRADEDQVEGTAHLNRFDSRVAVDRERSEAAGAKVDSASIKVASGNGSGGPLALDMAQHPAMPTGQIKDRVWFRLARGAHGGQTLIEGRSTCPEV